MALRAIFLLGSLFAGQAFAQQQQPTTATDRVALGLGQCLGVSEQRADMIADLQKQLAEATARLKELEPKTQGQAK